MPYLFPGMNPYLEAPNLWSEVHHLLISLLAESLNPQLLPRYRVAIEKRVYQMSGGDLLLVGIPDNVVTQARTVAQENPSATATATTSTKPIEAIVPMPLEYREGYLEVRDTTTQIVVTAIEILSPSNKRPGQGRTLYETKRENVLGSQTHLVEIDLLRGGEPMSLVGNGFPSDYRILVSRADRRPRADLYRFNLPDPIPAFPLPLRAGDAEPIIDLHALLNQVYNRAGYEVVLDYTRNPTPALSDAEALWLDALLRSQGLR